MRLVPLTQGKFAKVDDTDFEVVSKYKWTARKCGKRAKIFYAYRRVRMGVNQWIQQYMHTFIYGSKIRLDHRDGDGLNNQRENLRPATQAENTRNCRIRVHSSRYKGVSYVKSTGRWEANGSRNGNKVLLGRYHSPELAAMAYDEYARNNYGDFAKTNKDLGVL